MKNYKKICRWFFLATVVSASLLFVFNVFSGFNPQASDKTLSSEPDILWWFDLNAPSFGSAATADIDDDGKLEIVFGTYFNDENIYALNAEDGTLLWSYDTGGCNDASPVISDVDNDGKLEVVVPASSSCMIYCFDGATGDIEWSTSTGSNCIDSPPAVADVDDDNKPEIVFGTFNGFVFCLNGENGGVLWRINLGSDSAVQSGPNILDINGDGKLEIIVAQWDGNNRVYALRGDDGSVLWFSNIPQDNMYHGASFSDVDEDGKPELAIGCYDNHVYLLNAEDGSLEWSYAASNYVAAPTSIADLNNDGHLEIVFASYNTLGVLSHMGELLWSYTSGGSIFRGASIADLNNDKVLDIIFGSTDGILRVLSGDSGDEIWTYDPEEHYGKTFEIDHCPIVADFNNDGKLDVFVIGGYGVYPPQGNHGRAYMLSPYEGTGEGWLMFRHDVRHSGAFNMETPGYPPVARFSWVPKNPKINETVFFNASASYDIDGEIVLYEWDWDNDGNYDYSSDSYNATCSWSEPGSFLIKLKVEDDEGLSSTKKGLIEVSSNNQPPFVMITQPKNNSNISGIVTITGLASDPDGNETVEKVEVNIDDEKWLKANGTVTWKYVWDTTETSEGFHVIEARSFDGELYSDSEIIFVNVLKPDENPPGIEIKKPLDHSLYLFNRVLLNNTIPGSTIVIGVIDVRVTLFDNETGVDHAEFYVDDHIVEDFMVDENNRTITWTWSERCFGRHTLKIMVFDNAGNSAEKSIMIWKFF